MEENKGDTEASTPLTDSQAQQTERRCPDNHHQRQGPCAPFRSLQSTQQPHVACRMSRPSPRSSSAASSATRPGQQARYEVAAKFHHGSRIDHPRSIAHEQRFASDRPARTAEAPVPRTASCRYGMCTHGGGCRGCVPQGPLAPTFWMLLLFVQPKLEGLAAGMTRFRCILERQALRPTSQGGEGGEDMAKGQRITAGIARGSDRSRPAGCLAAACPCPARLTTVPPCTR